MGYAPRERQVSQENSTVELSTRQHAICEFIEMFTGEHGYGPTVREIGRAVGIASASAVYYQILNLERAGLLTHTAGFSRTIVLTNLFRSLKDKQSPRPVEIQCGVHFDE
jgi:SOS-response transcriptional repressor LexA